MDTRENNSGSMTPERMREKLKQLDQAIFGKPILVWIGDKCPRPLQRLLNVGRYDWVALLPPYWTREVRIDTEILSLLGPLVAHKGTFAKVELPDGWVAYRGEMVQPETRPSTEGEVTTLADGPATMPEQEQATTETRTTRRAKSAS